MKQVFLNGNVVTMDPNNPQASAFAILGDRFVAVGHDAEIRDYMGSDAEVVDLKRKTVVPGFIETHNHLSYYALTLVMADCTPRANTRIRDIQDKIRQMAESAGPGQWVIGWGYDDTQIEEMRHLHRTDLDEAAPENPVFIYHASGHLSYANTMALKLGNVTKSTPQPQGGTIHKDDRGEPTGLLMEPAAQHLVGDRMPQPDASVFKSLLPEAIAHYHRVGVTSTHDAAIGIGAQGMGTVRAYRELEDEDRLNIRVYMTTLYPVYDRLMELGLGRGFGSDLLKIGSVKMFQDGSIQGLTAALSQDYFNKPGFRGELIMPQAAMERLVEKYHKEDLQIAVHANGDAAIESVIVAMEKAQAAYPQSDLRHMIIHSQTATTDQIKRMKKLGIIPSYFPGHVYYWGDRHHGLFLGPERAARIDPLGSSVREGLRFTLHADTPVTPISPLFSMHCAVNRITRDGRLLGPEERIPAYEALKTFTTDAAYCSYEEEIKGSIGTGKLADFVVLSDNPVSCPPEQIKDIDVLKTVVGGRAVYTA
jgi:predicted amidohydrolase YtcJ